MGQQILRRMLVSIFPACLLLGAGTMHAQDVEQTIRQADQAFNDGKYTGALELYRTAAARLEAQSPLYAEVINNIAAVNMAQRDLPEFSRNFALARSLKQERIARVTEARDQRGNRNLLKNGGFEDGIVFPWGTGNYERSDGKFSFGLWWNSNNAKAFMKIDTAEKHSGTRSLLIGNFSPAESHVFSTLSQRISGLKPNTIYRIACHVRATGLKPGAGLLIVDAAWSKRFALPSGTFDWRPFSITVNIGHNDYIDFRIVHQDTGLIWLDDIAVEELTATEDADSLQHAESLFDSARYAEALKIYLEFERNNQGNEGALRHYKLYAGRIYAMMGKYDQAFSNINWAVDKGLVRGNIDLADLYYQLGDFQAAESHFNKILELGLFKEDQATISLIWHKLSQSYLASGKLEKALQAQHYSYTIVTRIDDKHAQAVSLHQLGGIYRQRQAYAPAGERLLEAYRLAKQLDDRKLQSDIALDLAEIAQQARNSGEIKKYLAEAMPVKEAIADRVGLVKALRLQGQLFVAENRLDDALASYRRAVSALEGIATGVGDISRQTKATFLQQFSLIYKEYVEILIQRFESTRDPAYHREAFQVAEQARSRVFSEMVTEARASETFAATSSDPEFRSMLEKDRLVSIEISTLEKQYQQTKTSVAASDLQLLTQRLGQARQDRQTLQERLLAKYPRYADLKTPKALRVEDVQQLLEADEAALSYFVTPTLTALWAITREEATFVAIPLSRNELVRQSETFRSIFAKIVADLGQFEPGRDGEAQLKSSFAAYRTESAHALYKTLVAPAERILRSKRSVYLAPDDLLYKLPFEALLTKPFAESPVDDSVIGAGLRKAPFWVNTHAIVYVPSLSVLRSLRQFGKVPVAGQRPLLAFADPDFGPTSGAAGPAETLPGNRAATRAAILRSVSSQRAKADVALPPLPDTREEALYVAKILGAAPEKDVYLGAKASEYNLKHLLLGQYRNLLFSTHGLMAGDFGPGTQPALALSFVGDPENDGLLEMGEILGLDLNADLVVLSACNTASGSGGEDRGEGFAGLTRSFMYAGSRSLLVTQWSVESSSAKKLVQSTFSRMTNARKAEALARAKHDMIAAPDQLRISGKLAVSLAHPFFWAPFVLVGEGR